MFLKSTFLIITVFILSLNAVSCALKGDDTNTNMVDLRINHFKQTGFGPFAKLVYLAQEGQEIGEEDWEYFYDEIEGFNYESGYVYDLKVRKELIENPPEDASSIRYILEKVVSKLEVSAEENFNIRLKWNGQNFVVTGSDDRLSLFQEYEINCAALCTELTTSLEENAEVTGTFVHDSPDRLKLISIQ